MARCWPLGESSPPSPDDEPDPGAAEPAVNRAVRPTLEAPDASGAAAAAMAGSVLDDGDGASASAPGTDTWAHEPGEHPEHKP